MFDLFPGLFGGGKKWRESEAERNRRGRVTVKPAGTKKVRELQATARAAMDLEDRRGPRLRWGAAGVKGWWYIPKGGAVYWVRRQSKPAMIRNHYYIPSSAWPITPPKEHWASWKSYHGIAGKTVLSNAVPDDVWQAAAHEPRGRASAEEPSARSEALRTRRRRGGVDPDYQRKAGLKATTPTRKRKR